MLAFLHIIPFWLLDNTWIGFDDGKFSYGVVYISSRFILVYKPVYIAVSTENCALLEKIFCEATWKLKLPLYGPGF